MSDLDLKNAYFQRMVDARDQYKLGFCWKGKQYHFKRALQDVTFISSAFQRLMSVVFAVFGHEVVCYLDNIWVVTNGGLEKHFEVLRKIRASELDPK